MARSIFTFKEHALCHQAIGKFLESFVAEVVGRKGHCSMALPGGKSPAPLFRCLASAPFCQTIPWKDVLFFWGDERCVAPDHAASNYGMARDNLLRPLLIADQQIFRMPGEVRPYEEAACRYQKTLQQVLPTGQADNASDQPYPSFDLIMLGMGEDGHTASLFPEHPVLADKKMVAAVESAMAEPPVPRLTLTLPVINSADTVLFMVQGRKKLALVESFIQDPARAEKYPAAQVRPKNKLYWYLVG